MSFRWPLVILNCIIVLFFPACLLIRVSLPRPGADWLFKPVGRPTLPVRHHLQWSRWVGGGARCLADGSCPVRSRGNAPLGCLAVASILTWCWEYSYCKFAIKLLCYFASAEPTTTTSTTVTTTPSTKTTTTTTPATTTTGIFNNKNV